MLPDNFIKIGDRRDAWLDYLTDEPDQPRLTFEEFNAELDKGYGNSAILPIARLLVHGNSVYYDNEYAG